MPELRATSELFLRDIHYELVNAGLEDVMKIGFLKQRNIDASLIKKKNLVYILGKKYKYGTRYFE